jgi:YD repeat-containing protein
MPLGISKDGQSVITVESNVAGQVAAFVFNGKRYEVEYAERPITEILLGQVAVKELDQALSSFKYPDGKSDTFKFGMTPDRVPTLTSTDKEGKQTLYSWDGATSHLVTEKGAQGDWTYQIGKITQPFGQPPVARTNSDGKSESVIVDNKTGTTTETALDGEVTIRTVFKTPGSLYGKLREITTSLADSKARIRFGYDEMGRLIRRIDTNGFITAISYGPDGKISKQTVLPPSDPTILIDLRNREENYQKAISEAKTSNQRDDALQQIAFFYIYQMGNIDKALGEIKLLSNPNRVFAIKSQAISGNRNLSPEDKVSQLQVLAKNFPDQAGQLSSELASYQNSKNQETNQ